MSVFVDTSVWSLALRRDAPPDVREVCQLRRSLQSGSVICTGLVLQELLQGFTKPKARTQIVAHFSAVPLLIPDRDDHIRAAELRNRCRRRGVQTGTIDALLAQLCIRHGLRMLSTDNDFRAIAMLTRLELWK